MPVSFGDRKKVGSGPPQGVVHYAGSLSQADIIEMRRRKTVVKIIG